MHGRTIIIISVVMLLSACATQEPVEVQYHGDEFYGTAKGTASRLETKRKRRQASQRVITVAQGDTLYDIARRYDVPARELIDANGLNPPYTLKVGQRLKYGSPKFYEVQEGDTIYSIAQRYDVEMSQLAQNNGLDSPDAIDAGQRIRIPYSTVTSGSGEKKSWLAGLLNLGKYHKPDVPGYRKPAEKRRLSVRPEGKPVKTASLRPVSHKPLRSSRSSRSGAFIWPVKGRVISGFGPKEGGVHNDGINIAASEGADIKAAAGGTVVYVGDELKNYGNLVIIRHNGGWLTAYAHQSRILVKQGQEVSRGQVIGRVGKTGKVKKPQLHFSLRKGREVIDPVKKLSS